MAWAIFIKPKVTRLIRDTTNTGKALSSEGEVPGEEKSAFEYEKQEAEKELCPKLLRG